MQISRRSKSDLLTTIIPTRNRPHGLPGQFRLLKNWTTPESVIVADSSVPEHAMAIRAAIPVGVRYLVFAPEMTVYVKLAEVVAAVTTPYVLLLSDRKITFPHGADAALAHLLRHGDHVAAQGYVVGFSTHENDVDINRVVFFTPTIHDLDPLRRLYHLMSRYQSRQFSVFRTEPLATSLRQARLVDGPLFQEIMFMNAMVLQGKMARVPNIITLQTTEVSFHLPKDNDPFYWFLADAHSFGSHYLRYRSVLTQFIRERGIVAPPGTGLEQLVDTIHAVWLRRNFDDGVLNHAVQLQLGDAIAPLPHPIKAVVRREIGPGDIVGASGSGRRYIWRREVLAAIPQNEINISPREAQYINRQLDNYFGYRKDPGGTGN